MQQLTRRQALVGALGTGAVALAGCVSGNGDDPDDESDDQGDDSGTAELDSSIERVGSGCAGMGPGEAPVFLDDGEYVVQGTIPSPTPCYEPVIDSQNFENGTLSVTIDVTETDDGPCTDCVGEVLYDATVSGPDPSEVDSVSITHAGGKTHETPAEDIPEGVPALVDAEITDSESRPRDGKSEGTAEVDEIDDSSDTGTITITGKIPTEHPHHEAVLTDASVRAGTLSVSVDVESTLEDEQMGTMPLGMVEYTASAEIEQPAAIDSVQISHPNAGYGSSWASDSASASESATNSHGESSSSDGSS
ncbi:hypothetical protein [Halovenus sp. HT40]|uniref:hypothetical protein n=1 Tax=Halovenus sp. HT40 TaxID=3126691 RepID=UPI00300EBB23